MNVTRIMQEMEKDGSAEVFNKVQSGEMSIEEGTDRIELVRLQKLKEQYYDDLINVENNIRAIEHRLENRPVTLGELLTG